MAMDTTATGKGTVAERRGAARDAYRASLAKGVPLTGVELSDGSGCRHAGAVCA